MTLPWEKEMPIKFEKGYAPWTVEEVESINSLQWNPAIHPFTCPERGLTPHAIFGLPDKGALVATTRGWICVSCLYTQDWAYKFMLP